MRTKKHALFMKPLHTLQVETKSPISYMILSCYTLSALREYTLPLLPDIHNKFFRLLIFLANKYYFVHL